MKRLIPSLFLAVAAAVSLACAHVHHPRPLPGKARVTKPGPLLHTLQRMAMATTTTPPSWRLSWRSTRRWCLLGRRMPRALLRRRSLLPPRGRRVVRQHRAEGSAGRARAQAGRVIGSSDRIGGHPKSDPQRAAVARCPVSAKRVWSARHLPVLRDVTRNHVRHRDFSL